MRRNLALLLAVIMMLGLVSGCSAKDSEDKGETEASVTSDGAVDENTTYVGCLVSLSGTVGAWAGHSVIDGMNLAAERINADGGVLGTRIEVLDRDDEGTVATMSSEFEKLVSNYNIAAAFGVTTGNVSTPFNECLDQYHLPGVQFGGLMMDVNAMANGEGYDTKFNMASCDDTWSLAGYDFVVNDLGMKKLYIMGVDGITTEENANVYQQMAEIDGIEIVAVDMLSSSTNDFNAEILKMLSSDADCIVCLDGSDFGANFNKQAYELGLMDRFVVYNNGIPGIETMKVLSQEILQKTYWGGDFYYGYDNEETQEFAEIYYEKYGEYPADYAYYGYAALHVWAEACEKSGTFDTDAVVEAMKETSGDYGAGDMKFSWANNSQGVYYIMTGKNNEELAAGDEEDFMKVVTTKAGEEYIITPEEAAEYPIVLSKER